MKTGDSVKEFQGGKRRELNALNRAAGHNLVNKATRFLAFMPRNIRVFLQFLTKTTTNTRRERIEGVKRLEFVHFFNLLSFVLGTERVSLENISRLL